MVRPMNDNFVPPEYPEESTTPSPQTGTPTGGQSSADRVFVGTRRPSGVVDSWMPDVPVFTSKTQAEGMWLNLSQERRDEIDRLAKAIDPRRTGRSLYNEAINAAAMERARGRNVTPATFINQMLLEIMPRGGDALTGMGGGGRSGRAAAYTGPRTSVTLASERDLRNTADAIASTVLGRGITDEEFQSVLEKVRTAERAEAQVTTGGTAMTTTQAGLSAEGRQDVITRALMQGPEAEEFGRATKMMDLFYSALEARPEGA